MADGRRERAKESVPIFLHLQLLRASFLPIFWLVYKLINSLVRKQADGCPAVLCPVMPTVTQRGEEGPPLKGRAEKQVLEKKKQD